MCLQTKGYNAPYSIHKDLLKNSFSGLAVGESVAFQVLGGCSKLLVRTYGLKSKHFPSSPSPHPPYCPLRCSPQL